jgi:hypothetical protein
MSNPAWISVDVSAHLDDCPPHDEPIDEALIPNIAQEICRRFDYTIIYNLIDEYACQVLRERGIIKD